MSKVDHAAAWLLVLLGCVHNFVAAPMSFHALDGRALWFVTGGISLWFAGALNLTWLTNLDRGRIRWTAAAANLVMLAFVLTFAVVAHELAKPSGWLLIGTVAWLAARSTFLAPVSPRAASGPTGQV